MKVADRDFLETSEGYFFCVIGNKHPKDRVIAYLKYMKSRRGKWGGRGFRAERVLKYYTMEFLKDTLELLKREAPHYLTAIPCVGVFSAVPVSRVIKHYVPEEKLRSLLSKDEKDPLEAKAASLASMIAEKAGVSVSKMGVTGSILLNMHNTAFSDIDLTVYGKSEASLVREALIELYSQRLLRRKMDAGVWRTDSIPPFGLEKLLKRRWNRGEYMGTEFSVLACREREEIGNLSVHSCVKLGKVVLRAVIEDDEEGVFYPAIYRIGRVEVLEGDASMKPTELICLSSLYSGTLLSGDAVEIRGELEVADGEARVVVGSLSLAGKDYIMLR
ncbi:MAG: hypothetical protein DRN96_04070 [Thermoproteota archaeon]|nr:MAG: hypothetical protein DRN96_04070 [Candidatus Korarchaeota archaeon]RLG55529.1 MAG: hypothetical protein DRN99_02330 [Candidatus Korarchaeota archaeon]